MEKLIESLKKIGLTRYEAKAYIALNNLISAQASKISEISEIPRSKIYNTLKELNKKGFIEITYTRPLTYKVIPPKEIIKEKREDLNKELKDSEEKLYEIYNTQIAETYTPIWLIKSSENIINKELEIIQKAKKSINMRIGFLLEGEGEEIIRSFHKLPPHIPIKILAAPYCYRNGERVEIIQLFKNAGLDNLEIIKTDIPHVKIIIIDKKEYFRTIIRSNKEQSILPETAVGVLNQYKDICRNYDDRFLNQFMKVRNKKHQKETKSIHRNLI